MYFLQPLFNSLTHTTFLNIQPFWICTLHNKIYYFLCICRASRSNNGTWSAASTKNSWNNTPRGRSRPALNNDTFKPPSRPQSRTTSASPGPWRRRQYRWVYKARTTITTYRSKSLNIPAIKYNINHIESQGCDVRGRGRPAYF